MQQGVYKHYKGGLYTLLMSAKCSENGMMNDTVWVIYVSHTTGQVCCRSAWEFFSKAENGKPRFEFVCHAFGLAVNTADAS